MLYGVGWSVDTGHVLHYYLLLMLLILLRAHYPFFKEVYRDVSWSVIYPMLTRNTVSPRLRPSNFSLSLEHYWCAPLFLLRLGAMQYLHAALLFIYDPPSLNFVVLQLVTVYQDWHEIAILELGRIETDLQSLSSARCLFWVLNRTATTHNDGSFEMNKFRLDMNLHL